MSLEVDRIKTAIILEYGDIIDAPILLLMDIDSAHRQATEELISENSRLSFWYAQSILVGRFELGESAIARDEWCALAYARNILKGRFELCEPVVAKNPYAAYSYAEFLGERFKPGEQIMKGTSMWKPYCEMFPDVCES